jgi:PAS domain S-box-containing protein
MSIKKRIYLSFSILISLFVVNAAITFIVLEQNKKLSFNISEVIVPTLQNLNDFQKMAIISRMYSTNWVFLRSSEEDINTLKELNEISYPSLKKRLNSLALSGIQKPFYDSLRHAFLDFESLIYAEKRIMQILGNFDDYDNRQKRLEAEWVLQLEILPRAARIVNNLNKLIDHEQSLKNQADKSLSRSSDFLLYSLVSLAIIIIITGIVLSVYLTKIIIYPLRTIQLIIEELGRGSLKRVDHGAQNDEIGQMAEAVNRLSDNLSTKASFAVEIGRGNFESTYTPISSADFLGMALIRMQENLKQNEKDLKEVNYQLRESEKRFRSLIENSSDGIAIIDKEGNCIYLSPATEKIVGYSPSELIAKSGFLYIHPDDQQAARELLERIILMPRGTEMLILRACHKNGSYRWLECIASNFTDEKIINGIVINFRDITERRESEETLRLQNETLKKTNMELDRFVYSVSHDLRAPLTSMKGMINLLEDEISEETPTIYMDYLKASINKLDSFILEILDYSRNSRTNVTIDRINFKDVVQEIIDNLKYLSASRSIDFRINVSEQSPFFCDKSRLFVILNNLISNAIRYHDMMAERPFVEVNILSDDQKAEITVKDNGIGIPQDYHGKVFDMFYRVSNKSEGSGLGLYIVKETVEKLKGDIKLESEPGKGAKFVISISNQALVNN